LKIDCKLKIVNYTKSNFAKVAKLLIMTSDIKNFRVIFMGTSSFADVILNSLLDEKYNIIGVYTQTDKKVGRSRNLEKSIVKITAEKNDLDIYQPERFDEAAICELENLKPDLIIVAAYGKILPKKVLEIPRYKCINVHASLLPSYRGPSPIQNALLNGEKETGTTIMLMNEGIDTGDILSSEKISIGQNEMYPELLGKLASISSSLLAKTIPGWTGRKIVPEKQDDSKATFCKLIEKDDGHIFWSDSAQFIYDKYRSFCIWPGIFAYWERNGLNLRIKFNKVSLLKKNATKDRHLGEVFELEKGEVGIAAMQGIIIPEEIQLEGKNNMKIKDFINGYPDFTGSVLK
jgi:methionyl-tRNA formyltransferase